MRFGLSEIRAGARASHLLHWVVVYRFDFPLLVWSLVLRTLLYLAVVLPLLCHARLDRVSCFVSLMVWMVYLKCCCCGDLRWC